MHGLEMPGYVFLFMTKESSRSVLSFVYSFKRFLLFAETAKER